MIAIERPGGVSREMLFPGSGFPIGASSIPVGTRFSPGKSSVLYLCFRLTSERGWRRLLLHRQIDSRQTLFGGSRAGGFCSVMDKIRICSSDKIRLGEKGSKGIYQPSSQPSDTPRFTPFLPWISRGFCGRYTGFYTVRCKRLRWNGCLKIPSGSSCTGAAAVHRPPAGS